MKKILHFIDTFLSQLTMYRVILYSLLLLVAQSLVLSFLGQILYTPLQLLFSLSLLFATCYGINFFWSKVFRIAVNFESATITALILFCILSPATKISNIFPLLFACFIGMSSKYFFAVDKKHLFNPAAVAAFSLILIGSGAASWWIGGTTMIPLTLLLGMLILRKTKKFTVFASFFFVGLFTYLLRGITPVSNISDLLLQFLTSWPTFFFGMFMLTEPLTMPTSTNKQLLFAGAVGGIYGLQFHLGKFGTSPEFALLIGNVFSYAVSVHKRYMLTLQKKTKLSPTIYEFDFSSDQPIQFISGQYLEWTLAHKNTDSRGNRRYFTIASAPSDKTIKLGVKFHTPSSSFKRALLEMKIGESLSTAQLAGEFVLPKISSQKLVFIAGGIGVTPFRSMIQEILNKNEPRDIVFFYATTNEEECVYEELFLEAAKKLSLKYICMTHLNDTRIQNKQKRDGRISLELIQKEVPDFTERTFFISGPPGMVRGFEETLEAAGVKRDQIKSDFFPGFAD